MTHTEVMTRQMQRALHHLAARGELTVRREASIVQDEIATRTAAALERRGFAERRWSYGPDHDTTIYITSKGQRASDDLLGHYCDSCGGELDALPEPNEDGEHICPLCWDVMAPPEGS